MRHVIGRVSDFPDGERRIIAVGGRSIGIFRIGERFFGIRNRCPHQGAQLCAGRIVRDIASDEPGRFNVRDGVMYLACPWHGWEYDLATGQSFLGPGDKGVKSYDVGRLSPAERERLVAEHGRLPGPYVAETYEVDVDDDLVVINT